MTPRWFDNFVAVCAIVSVTSWALIAGVGQGWREAVWKFAAYPYVVWAIWKGRSL